MRMSTPLILLLFALGCQSNGTVGTGASHSGGSQASEDRPAPATPVAYVNQRNVFTEDMRSELLEVSGGVVLREHILDGLIRRQLTAANLVVGQSDIDAEERRMTRVLSNDPNQASRLMRELRQRRGLGPKRYPQFLWRNAALRKLVAGEIAIEPAEVRRAYDLRYGQRYEVRLMVLPNASQAAAVKRRVDAGERFADLAIAESTDSSAARGGLLAPIHPQDPTYPSSVRAVLPGLKVGQVSSPIVLEQGVAVVQLQRVVPARAVQYAAVKDRLAEDVRLEAEETRMRQRARALVADADVVILDKGLSWSWERATPAAPVAP